MRNRFVFFICLLALAGPSSAAPMLRVVEVPDARTVVVETLGKRTAVLLAGVAVAPSESAAAAEWLRELLLGKWVLAETDLSGGTHLYRSPDGLYVNAEVLRRPWANRGRMTYIGEAAPDRGATASIAKDSSPRTPPAAPPKPKGTRSRGRRGR